MDPLLESSFSACLSPARLVRTPHETNLILTVSAGASWLLFPAVSGLMRCVIKKGPLIAGFRQ